MLMMNETGLKLSKELPKPQDWMLMIVIKAAIENEVAK